MGEHNKLNIAFEFFLQTMFWCIYMPVFNRLDHVIHTWQYWRGNIIKKYCLKPNCIDEKFKVVLFWWIVRLRTRLSSIIYARDVISNVTLHHIWGRNKSDRPYISNSNYLTDKRKYYFLKEGLTLRKIITRSC